MKRKYDLKVKQYSINGGFIKEYNNARDASLSGLSNYDSIIHCCTGKYKTAGGYVWKFENDQFSLTNKKDKKTLVECKICHSEESIRSMAMHLKWVHNMKTEDYIQQYEEFRPKFIRYNSGEITCKLCNKTLISNRQLMYHLTTSHKDITQSEYIIKYMYDDKAPLCKCGCGEEVQILRNGKNCDLNKDTYNRDYIKGHWDWEVFKNINNKQSKEEIELIDFIKNIYDGEIQTNVREIIDRREIDIYLPSLKIGIEYNGLYWHSEKAGRFKDYHIDKMNKANKVGIRLIQIFSDEWICKQDIVKEKLKSIICKNKNNNIFARKCKIQEISSKEKDKFLNKYHIQGEDRSKIKLGLYYNDELVAVMTFSKPRISLGGDLSLKDTYELSRYASSSYIVGGASKLIEYFKNKYNPIQIYSYSDNRWTDPNNNMYLKIGFIKTKSSSPNYFYTNDFLVRKHRYNFNKFKLKSMGADISKTESEIMKSMGYTRIWDCGSTKYILDIIPNT